MAFSGPGQHFTFLFQIPKELLWSQSENFPGAGELSGQYGGLGSVPSNSVVFSEIEMRQVLSKSL